MSKLHSVLFSLLLVITSDYIMIESKVITINNMKQLALVSAIIILLPNILGALLLVNVDIESLI